MKPIKINPKERYDQAWQPSQRVWFQKNDDSQHGPSIWQGEYEKREFYDKLREKRERAEKREKTKKKGEED